jgi:hypothetical protein
LFLWIDFCYISGYICELLFNGGKGNKTASSCKHKLNKGIWYKRAHRALRRNLPTGKQAMLPKA